MSSRPKSTFAMDAKSDPPLVNFASLVESEATHKAARRDVTAHGLTPPEFLIEETPDDSTPSSVGSSGTESYTSESSDSE